MQKLKVSENQVDPHLCLKEFILPNRIWNFGKLKLLPPDAIINCIKCIHIPVNPLPDEPIWGPSSQAYLR